MVSLPKDFHTFVVNYNMSTDKWDIENTIAMCVQEEERLRKEEEERKRKEEEERKRKEEEERKRKEEEEANKNKVDFNTEQKQTDEVFKPFPKEETEPQKSRSFSCFSCCIIF